ncbi:MAG: valine--tRNA ligase, partial [Bacillota bacterium]
EVFVKLYKKGLIYRGNRIINWCPSCQTALSDAEVEYREKDSNLWHMKYPYADGKGFVVVATTRPETMLGDTAVAVNPKDKRYKDIVGKELILPLTGRKIPVIADDYVEMEFGSGALKITPAHDPNDFEIGLRHNLEVIKVIANNGVMNKKAGKYEGLDRYEARKQIVKDLEAQGLMKDIEKYAHNVGECYRCNCDVEPMVSKQWFVKMQPLAEPAIKAVKEGETKFVPQRFEKIYYNWMENIKDWCISRQLWWGHRIPCWYCEDCGEEIVSLEEPERCKCNSKNIHQDEDVLDTWFSSALWPFSTLGYPDKSEDLEYFYPTSLLVTAYDIIFFWVARMIFSGIEHMGEVPFPEVLIHGIVRDPEGRKMSKSLGNGVDPLILIDRYGADSLRFSLSTGVAPGGDTRFTEDKMESSRNFMNKIWNASRYVYMNIEGKNLKEIDTFEYTPADKWILKKLNSVIREVRKNIDKYEIGLALGKLYEFVWSDFCDWYIELTKPVLYSDDEKAKTNALSVLMYVLKDILKLCHPFIPFVTEEIFSYFENKTLMIQKYPVENQSHEFERENFDIIKDIIVKIRNIRAEMNVKATKKIPLYIVAKNEKQLIEECRAYIEKLAGVSQISFIDKKEDISQKVSNAITNHAELYIPLGELIDFDKETERLDKELKKVEKEIERGQKMLSNKGFLAKAPEKLVEEEKKKLKNNIELIKKINSQIDNLK